MLKRRTHRCGELTIEDVGRQVTLQGWVWRWRDHGGVVFIDLRDVSGFSQIVFNPDHNPRDHERAQSLRSEYVLAVSGTVRARPPEGINPKIPTGQIEVFVDELDVLSEAETPPFPIEDDLDTREEVRLRHRYIDLRRPVMQRILKTRHQVCMSTRNYLSDQGFLEVETPILAKSTPEGARDYLVPSRVNKGHFYALPQSPQIFKQLLMVSGIDRYFQIARCFRDEDLRADRQPEFTQIDIELSFATPELIYEIMEGLVCAVWTAVHGKAPQTPFLRLSYQEALDRFGLDAPDMRFAMELFDLGEIARKSEFKVFQGAIESGGIVKGLCVKGGGALSRSEIDKLTGFVATYGAKGLAWMKATDAGLESNIVKFFPEPVQQELLAASGAEPGDLLLFGAGKKKVVYDSMGQLREHLAARMGIVENRDAFLWVIDFPMFEEDDRGNPTPTHHPFTMVHPEDLDRIETQPLSVRSLSYDLVLNGHEIAGGTIREHRREVQRRIFKTIGLSDEEAQQKFGFLLEAFRYGPPPHGGIAFGLDRLIMILTGMTNIRDVIAFPKTQKATDLMSDAPSEVALEQLQELGIRVALGGA